MNMLTFLDKGMVKRVILAFFSITLVIFCGGCFVEVDTVLKMDSPKSGTRTMVLVINKQTSANNKTIKKSVAEVKKIIADNTPKDLEFAGIEEKNDKYYATFNLKFKNLVEYQTKVENILAAKRKAEGSRSDSDADETEGKKNKESVIKKYDSALLKGVYVNENFKSGDLLSWLKNVLVTNGVADADDISYGGMHENSTKVIMQGKTYDVDSRWGDAALGKGFVDNGFTRVDLKFDLREGQPKSADIYYVVDRDVRAERVNATNAYLKGLKDVTVEKVSAAEYRNGPRRYYNGNSAVINKVEVKAADADRLYAKVRKLIGAEFFRIEQKEIKILKDRDDKIVQPITVEADCNNICSPKGDGVTTTLMFPKETEVVKIGHSSYDKTDDAVLLYGRNNWSANYVIDVKMTAIKIIIQVDGEKSFGAVAEFILSENTKEELVKIVGEQLKKLAPAGKADFKGHVLKFSFAKQEPKKLAYDIHELISTKLKFKAKDEGWFGSTAFVSATASLALPYKSEKFSLELQSDGKYGIAGDASKAKRSVQNTEMADDIEVSADLKYTNWIAYGVLGVIVLLIVAILVLVFLKRDKLFARFTKHAAAPADYYNQAGQQAYGQSVYQAGGAAVTIPEQTAEVTSHTAQTAVTAGSAVANMPQNVVAETVSSTTETVSPAPAVSPVVEVAETQVNDTDLSSVTSAGESPAVYAEPVQVEPSSPAYANYDQHSVVDSVSQPAADLESQPSAGYVPPTPKGGVVTPEQAGYGQPIY